MIALTSIRGFAAATIDSAAVWRSPAIVLAGLPANVDELAAELVRLSSGRAEPLLIVSLPLDRDAQCDLFDCDSLNAAVALANHVIEPSTARLSSELAALTASLCGRAIAR